MIGENIKRVCICKVVRRVPSPGNAFCSKIKINWCSALPLYPQEAWTKGSEAVLQVVTHSNLCGSVPWGLWGSGRLLNGEESHRLLLTVVLWIQ